MFPSAVSHKIGHRLYHTLLLISLLDTGADGSGTSWDGLSRTLRNLSGSCSILASGRNSFNHNFASKAGGALYLSDLGSAHFNCTSIRQTLPAAQLNNAEAVCSHDNWSGNRVSKNTRAPGYGPILASLPAKMEVSAPSMDKYISDGTSTPAIAIHILDQAGTRVTSGIALLSRQILPHLDAALVY